MLWCCDYNPILVLKECFLSPSLFTPSNIWPKQDEGGEVNKEEEEDGGTQEKLPIIECNMYKKGEQNKKPEAKYDISAILYLFIFLTDSQPYLTL